MFCCNRSSNVDVNDDQPPTKKSRIDPFADMRDGQQVDSNHVGSSRLSGREELARYKAMQVPAKHVTPLDFWKQHAAEFPLMSEVARRVLSISASSAQSERDFSSVGRTITDARSRLSPKTVESLELVRWGLRASLITRD